MNRSGTVRETDESVHTIEFAGQILRGRRRSWKRVSTPLRSRCGFWASSRSRCRLPIVVSSPPSTCPSHSAPVKRRVGSSSSSLQLRFFRRGRHRLKVIDDTCCLLGREFGCDRLRQIYKSARDECVGLRHNPLKRSRRHYVVSNFHRTVV